MLVVIGEPEQKVSLPPENAFRKHDRLNKNGVEYPGGCLDPFLFYDLDFHAIQFLAVEHLHIYRLADRQIESAHIIKTRKRIEHAWGVFECHAFRFQIIGIEDFFACCVECCLLVATMGAFPDSYAIRFRLAEARAGAPLQPRLHMIFNLIEG